MSISSLIQSDYFGGSVAFLRSLLSKKTHLILFLLLGTALSCTRSVHDLGVNVTFPISKESSLGANDKIQTLILNLHNVPGKPNPWYFEFNFENTTFNNTVEITDVPMVSGVIIQVLGVYENTVTGNLRLAYAGKHVDLSQTSEVTVTLNSQNADSRMAEVSGRYLRASAPHPSGTLSGYFVPYDGLPKMKVWESAMTGGWFRAIALEETATNTSSGFNSGLSFQVEGPLGVVREALFENLRFKEISGEIRLYSGSVAAPTEIPVTDGDAKRVLISKPLSYRNSSGTLKAEGERMIFMGFFGPGAGATNKICYPTVHEGLLRAKKETAPNSGVYEPLDIELSASAVSGDKVRRLRGGQADSFSDHYSHSGTCSPSNPNHLLLKHQFLGERVEEALGMNPPFQDLSVLSPFPHHIEGSFSGSSLSLSWSLLDGALVGPDAVSGYELYYKASTNSSGGGGDIHHCEDLGGKGFTKFADLSTPASQSYSVTSLGGVTLTNSNWTGYQFALCAFAGSGSTKRYVGNYVTSQCMGTCDDLYHTGWAYASQTHTISAGTTFDSSINAGVTYVSGVTPLSGAQSHLMKLDVADHSIFSAGDEVMLVVQARGGTSDCGSHNGQNISIGRIHSTRVVNSMSGSPNYIYIKKGSWIDSLTNLSASVLPGSTFCFVQAIKVPHFRQFTVDPGYSLAAPSFNFGVTPGGVVALRVNGALTMANASSFDVSQKGFKGGTNLYMSGAGINGTIVNSTVPGHAQGQASNAAGGGGGGVVGNGGSNSLGGGYMASGGSGIGVSNSPLMLAFGGGGGYGHRSSPATQYFGGSGGGSIFVSAEKLVAPATGSPAYFRADGEEIPVNANDVSGGGGGGAVNVFFKSVSGKVELSAQGGDGGDNNTVWESFPGGAGNGGGGFISAVMCNLPADAAGVALPTTDITWKTEAGTNDWKLDYGDGSQDGNAKIIRTSTSSQWSHYCLY